MEVKRKKVQVVILSTSDRGKGLIYKSSARLHTNIAYPEMYKDEEVFHLYFLSDDEIKEGDYVYHKTFHLGKIIKEKDHPEELFITIPKHSKDGSITTPWKRNIPNIKKVIASTAILHTGPKLTKTGEGVYANYLPKPSKAFIEKYVKEGGIEWVDVEYNEKIATMNFCSYFEYDLKIDSHNTITIHPIKNNWNKDELHFLLHQIVNDVQCLSRYKLKRSAVSNDCAEVTDRWIKDNL